MKALSIQEPWITMIRNGEKTIETRTWATRYRGPLMLVGSKSPVGECSGKAVCVCYLADCRLMTEADEQAAQCYWEPGSYSWILEDVKAVRPFAVRGQLGLYDVPVNLDRMTKEGWFAKGHGKRPLRAKWCKPSAQTQ